jgi:hypothetical protein
VPDGRGLAGRYDAVYQQMKNMNGVTAVWKTRTDGKPLTLSPGVSEVECRMAAVMTKSRINIYRTASSASLHRPCGSFRPGAMTTDLMQTKKEDLPCLA